ncbi:hypothetical protein UMN179_01042 [Gallibacterium anatis UMN179]|uniref:Uncharacterized protein n=1 Tax=Gallibacterium anatis (strain UMN179) TaxID=1005058 RepID=F4HFM9_GALAU|nr:hypothetical protein UMN179_01042 [Gallibacterium anatis UMN179]
MWHTARRFYCHKKNSVKNAPHFSGSLKSSETLLQRKLAMAGDQTHCQF